MSTWLMMSLRRAKSPDSEGPSWAAHRDPPLTGPRKGTPHPILRLWG